MTKWILGLTLLLSALTGASAEANSIIVSPQGSGKPYQSWIDTAAVPSPDVQIEVWEAQEDICGGGAAACAIGGRYAEDHMAHIWFDARYFGREPTRPIFYHELGHIFDDEVLAKADRRWYKRLIDSRARWTYADFEAPVERFAESYRRCAMGLPEISSVCEFIRAAYER